jgi:hypothetical protein
VPLSAYRAQKPVLVWPDNRQAVLVFRAMRTQWRTAGMGGFLGLDYGVLPEMWRRLHIQPKDRDRIFGDLQVMEDAALEVIHRKD